MNLISARQWWYHRPRQRVPSAGKFREPRSTVYRRRHGNSRTNTCPIRRCANARAAATAAQAVKEIDEHLGYGFRVTAEGKVIVQIAPLTKPQQETLTVESEPGP